MNIDKYETLLADPSVVKLGDHQLCILKDAKETIAINLAFTHTGDNSAGKMTPEKRVLLNVFPLKNLAEGLKAQAIGEKTIVVCNADDHLYSLSYTLNINNETLQVNFKLLDLPELGENFITREEKEGMHVSYNRQA